MSTYSVEAILRAVDQGFSSTLASAQKQLSAFQKSSQTGSEVLGKVGDSMVRAGKMATVGLTVPLVAGAKKAVQAYRGFDDSMRRVSATIGDGAKVGSDAYIQLEKQAMNLGASTRHSASDVADGMNYMAMAGWKTEQIMSGIPKVLDLATASGMDLATTSDIVTDAMTAFGIEVGKNGENVAKFSDVLAATSANANTNVGIMGETFKYVAPVAGALGYSIEDTSLAIGLMANAGIKGSQAGTALKAGLVNLAKPTTQMKTAMDKYGISLTDSEGNMKSFRDVVGNLRSSLSGLSEQEQAAAVATIFGKEAMAGWQAIINATDDDLAKLTTAIDNSTGATEQMVATIDGGIGGSFESFKSAVEGVSIALGKQMEPALAPITAKLTSMLQAFAMASPEVQQAAIRMGLFAAAIGPALMVTGKLTSVMASVWGATGKMAGGIVNFAGSTKTAFGTLGKGIAGFGSQIGGIVNTAFPQLKSGFETVAIKGMYAWDGIKAGASNMVAGVGGKLSIFQATMGSTFSRIGAFGGQMTSVLGQSFGLMSGIIQNFAGVAMSALMPAAIFGVFLVGLGLLQSQFGEQIGQMAQIAISKGPTIIDNLVQGIVSKIPALISQGTQLVSTFADVIVANAPSVIQGAVALIQALVQGVGSNAGSLISSAVRVIGVFVDGILSALPQLLATGMQFLVQLAQGVVQNIPLILSTALRIVQNFVQSVVSAAPAILSAGVQLIVTLVTGLIQNLPQIISTGVQIISAFIKGLVQVLPLVAVAGLMLIVKLVTAIWEGKSKIVEAAWELITGFFTTIWDGITTFGETIVSGITSLWDMVTGKTSEGAAQAKASVDELTAHTSTKTAEMQQTAGTNIDAMSTDLLTKFSATNAGGSAELDALLASVNGSTAGIAEAGATGSQSFMDSIMTNFAGATEAGVSEVNALKDGVNAATNAIDVPTQADLASYFNAVSTNTAQATATGTAEAEALATGVGVSLDQLPVSAESAMGQVSSAVSTNFTEASSQATSQAQAMADGVNTALSTMGTDVETTMTTIGTSVSTGMTEVATTATTQAAQMRSGVDVSFSQMGTGIQTTMSTITTAISQGMSTARSIAQTGAQAIANSMRNGFNTVRNTVQTTMSAVTSNFNSSMNQLKATATSTTASLTSSFRSMATSIQSVVASMMSQLVASVSSGMSQVLAVSSSTGSQMVAIFMALQGQMVSAGAFAGQGFASGLASQAGSIMAVAQGIANSVSSTIRAALNIHSPSRLTRKLGGYTGEGFYLGLADWEGKVEDMSEVLAESAVPDVDSLDLAANLGSMPSAISHSGVVTVSHQPQPLQLLLSMGREKFSLFVEDIFNMYDRQERYRLRSSSR